MSLIGCLDRNITLVVLVKSRAIRLDIEVEMLSAQSKFRGNRLENFQKARRTANFMTYVSYKGEPMCPFSEVRPGHLSRRNEDEQSIQPYITRGGHT